MPLDLGLEPLANATAAAVGVGPRGTQQLVAVVETEPATRRPGLAGSALADAVRADTASLRGRLTELAEPLVGEEAPRLAEELLLVVTGELAMRLRGGPLGGTSAAGRVADAVVSASLRDQGLRA